jgi:acyl carrier protein
MSIDAFRAHLAAQIGRDPESVPFDADLRREADLDSIEMFLLVVAVEDLGVRFPEEMLAQVVTIEDAYHHFVTRTGHGQ